MRIRFYIFYIILVALQIVLGNYLDLTQYVTLCFLPAMILALPVGYGTIGVMCIAFVTGLAVDFFTHGILGLTIIALVPVAFCRRWLIAMVFGGDVLSRGEDISIDKHGLAKSLLSILIATAIYLGIYIVADGAGTRPSSFNALRFACSIVVSTVVSVFVSHILKSSDRWS